MSDIAADPRTTASFSRTGIATLAPRRKVVAAAGGSGVATALAVLVLYLLKQAGVELPDRIEDAFSTVFVAMVTFASGYLCPPDASEGVVRDGGTVRVAQLSAV